MSAPSGSAGKAYFVRPDNDSDNDSDKHHTGPGLLLLHSWWGLTESVKAEANAWADAGFVVLVPDLLDGKLPETSAEAEVELADTDPNATAALLLSSVATLRSQTDDPAGPVSVLGYSMGASWALWLATRQPDSVRAVVAYYGTQDIAFDDLTAPVLLHFAERDDLVSGDDAAFMEAQLRLLDKTVEVVDHPGTGHWFAEPGVGNAFDEAATTAARERSMSFIRGVLAD